MPSFRVFVLLLLAPALTSAQSPSYVGQVQPFFARYCTSCHAGEKAPKGVQLGTLEGVKKCLVPGDLEKSRIVRHLQPVEGVKPMPPAGQRQPLPEEIDMIREWVAQGARDDSGSSRWKIPDVASAVTVKPPVTALAFAPNGKLLAGASGRTAALVDSVSGEIRGRIEGLEGNVTAIAFRPDGKVLAIASGHPGALGEVAFFEIGPEGMPALKSTRRITAHLDLVHELAFSPDGAILATCAYDRVVRLWEVSTGNRLRELRDHSDSVYGLGFSHDGKYLASAGADRAVKIWDVKSGKRLYTLGEATDWVYTLAWHPTQPILAAAGVDRNIRVWDITDTEGKLRSAAFAHEGPVRRLVYGPQGKTLYSVGEDQVCKAWDAGQLVERRVYPRQSETIHALAVRPDGQQLALGRHDGVLVLLEEATGKSQPAIPVSAVTAEENAGGSIATGQTIALTTTVTGKVFPAGDIDFYRFNTRVGQEIGVQVVTPTGSKLESILELFDPRGNLVASSSNGLLAHVCTEAGKHSLSIRDREFRGEAGFAYTLKVGAVPVVTSVFPLGLPRGQTGEVTLTGANLGTARKQKISIPADAVPGSKIELKVQTPLGSALGNPQVGVGEFAESTQVGSLLPIPGAGNGRIEKVGQVDTWRFTARKGERLIVETEARRIGSALDSMIEITDAGGNPVPIATLRGVAKVYTTFRDNDSVTSGMRLESWNELSVNDYVLVGTELARIQTLPRNPDDDCRFFTEAGQRLGYLGTTPTHHPLGSAIYKVSIHPPGTKFPPNGLPVVDLFARNDDGGPGYGKDSRLSFDPPADGEYQVRVSDSRSLAGPDQGYRVTVRRPRPDFNVRLSPMNPSVSKGGAVSLEVTAQRIDDYQGPINIEVQGLPPGLSAPRTTILAGENSTSFALEATPTATNPAGGGPAFRVVARASIDGKTIEKTVAGGKPRVIEPGDIVTTTEQKEITIVPGGQTAITVLVERRNGFAGRIPIDVRGLPHGVRVLDIGLNGILITPRETRRTFLLYAEPWVAPTDHPIVVLGRHEAKKTEHAAPGVLLRVQGKQP